MKLSEVMRETGLTKKAIYYYEEEGLIHPQKDSDTHYRNYSNEDMENLIVIQVMRKLDFTMKEIEPVITSKQNIMTSIVKQLNYFNSEIERLSRSKAVLESFIAQPKEANVEALKALANQLDVESKKSAGYMVKELDRILPGNLGKMFAIHYNQFLEEPLDTKEKEDAWKGLIHYLDSCEEIQYPEHIKRVIEEMYGRISEDQLTELNEKARTVTDKILAGTPTVDETTKKEMNVKLEEYQKTKEYQNFLVFQQFTKDHLQPIFEKVDEYIGVISPRYKEFHKILRENSPR